MNIKNRIKFNNRGFSFIELMVSMAMLAILTAIFLNINKFSNTRTSLILSSNQVKSAIRLAQTYSLSIPNPEDNHICGYGVSFYNVSGVYGVKIFYTHPTDADFKNNVNICEDESIYRTYDESTANATVIETYDLNEDISLDQVGRSLFFKTPYADVYDNDGTVLGSDFEIEVISTGDAGNRGKTIAITSEGRVFEKN